MKMRPKKERDMKKTDVLRSLVKFSKFLWSIVATIVFVLPACVALLLDAIYNENGFRNSNAVQAWYEKITFGM